MSIWRPAERIKYKPSSGHWPSAEEAAASALFAPISFGALTLEQRTWVPAMVPWRATEQGDVTPAVVDWYERFAAGKPGAIVVEATGIRDVPSGPLLRIGHDRYLDGLRKIVAAVKRASEGETRLFIQLIDFLAVRRRVDQTKYLTRFLPKPERYAQSVGLSPGEDDDLVRRKLSALDDETLATYHGGAAGQ